MAADGEDAADDITMMPPDGAVERGYRRLLRWYPRSHRAVYGEEMLGVLIAGARPGQRRPGTGESANLLAGAAVLRMRRAAAWLTGESWQDAFAMLSVAGPVLMLMLVVQYPASLDAVFPGQALTSWWAWEQVLQYTTGPQLAAWLAVLLLALANRRRTAAGLAGLATAFLACLALAGRSTPVPYHQGLAPDVALWIFTGVLAFASLAFSAGPRRGLPVLGQRRAALLLALGLAAAAGDLLIGGLVQPWRHGVSMIQHLTALWTSPIRCAALLVVVIMVTGDRAGRRAAALAAPVAALTGLEELGNLRHAGPGLGFYQGLSQMSVAVSALYVGLAVIVTVLAIASRRGSRVTTPFATAASLRRHGPGPGHAGAGRLTASRAA